MKMKTLMMAAATTAFMAVSSVAFASAVVHPATDWTGQGTWPPVTATPGTGDDSAAQDKATFGDLGEQSVVDAMNTDAWFGTIAGFTLSVSDLIASSGDCGTGNVTCDSSASWTGDAGESANLFVIHTGRGSSGTQGGNTAVDTIFAFFF